MFRLFAKETVVEVFNKTSIEDQARLAQVDKRFNEISKDETLELSKYKTKCIIHSVDHTHVVIREGFRLFSPYSPPYPFSLHLMKGNKKAYDQMPLSTGSLFNLMIAMNEGTLSLIEELNSRSEAAKRIALHLQEAIEEENRSTLKK